MRRRHGRAWIVAAVTLLYGVGTQDGFASAATPRDRWPSHRYAAELAQADSLRSRGVRRVHAYLDSLIAASRTRGETDLEMVASLRNAETRGFVEGAFDSAVAESRRWLGPIQASGDTQSWCLALRTIGYADLARARYPSSLVTYRQMLPLAQRARLTILEGYAWIGVSYIAIKQGRLAEAERGYRNAIRQLETHDAWAARTARAGLANVLYSQARPEPARREYERVLADARAAGDLFNEGDALNDLATIELQFGDPSRAMALYRDAVRLHQRIGRDQYSIAGLRNIGVCLAALGRVEEQVALLDSVEHAAEALGAYDIVVASLADIGRARRRQGHLDAAEAALLRAMRYEDSVSVQARSEVIAELVRVETLQGRPEVAARTARAALESLRPYQMVDDRADLFHALGKAELAAGNAAEAVIALRSCSALVQGFGGAVGAAGIEYEISLAGAFASLGQRDSVLAHYRRAARLWEQLRVAPSDLSWRETFDGAGARLYGPFAAALLDPARGGTPASRVTEAFDALQRFRARTLEDALRGREARAAVPRVSLAELQHLLRPGEALLDVFASPDTTFLFAVSPDRIELGEATGSRQLVPRLRRFRDALAAADADEAMLANAAVSVGADLLGSVAGILRGSPTLLFSAGSLSGLPLGMLRLPGESASIATLHRVSIVPSATLLAGSRRARARVQHRSGLVALSRSTDAEGKRLEGVARESRWLAQRFASARVRASEGTASLEEMVGEVGAGDVLHISSHTRGPAAAPWRAGFLLGRGAGEDAYLTASRITRLHPSARVCVLASCTSAGGSTSAEGLPNLAAAWLEAGVGTVIATLWNVEDRATEKFVQDLYDALARGVSTGEALASAQRAARTSRDRRSPRDWGGFVLLGDPTTRVSLVSAGSSAAGAPAKTASTPTRH